MATEASRHSTRNGNSYEEVLRKLGAWLDASAARCVVVTEAASGFTVRYERQDIDQVFMQRHFTYEELAGLRRGDLNLRRALMRRIGHKLQGFAGEAGGYQDLFRALGHTLDESSARSISVSENESESKLILRYELEQRIDGSMPSIPVTVLGPDEREALRKAAQARRHERGFLRRLR